MNKVVLLGRLVRDPELKNTQNGKAMTRFSVAVDRPKTTGQEKSEADFINCVAWSKQAEIVANHFVKGSRIALEGTIRTGSYTNNSGAKVNTFDVWVTNIEFVDKRGAQKQDNYSQVSPMDSFGASQTNGFDEEIPF